MSDDERDIDIESDDDVDSDGRTQSRTAVSQYSSQAEKRAHHNALERKRRDHIKDSFTALRDAVPSLQGEKVASRAQILKKAAEYITFMKRKNQNHQSGNDDLKRQNSHLDQQIRQLERQLTAAGETDLLRNEHHTSESDMSDIDDEESQVDIVSTPQPNAKKTKTSYNAKVMYQ
ncbi:protein max [Contarinia nasturtii]|uniref:protein max n=1 Tax=Contarinia nasturtii TaxID=265458 RepID=UPI0012D391CE|nr:protein max [Contarinia nasturtii]